MTIFFCAVNGNDSNNGSINTPFRTISRGIAALASGDTLFLRNGTYTESIDQNTQAIPSGSSFNNATTISAYQSEPVTIIKEVGTFRLVHIPFGSYIIFAGLILDGSLAGATVDIGSSGAHHLRFSNCEVKNARGFVGGSGMAGPNFYISGDGHELLNCNIHHSAHSYSFYAGSGNGLLVDGCLLHDNAGFGFQIYDGSTGGNNYIVRNNRIYNNGFSKGEDAGNIGSGGGHRFYNNLIYGNNGGIDSRPEANGNIIFSNTFYNNGYGLKVRGSNTQVKNNIFFSTGATINDTGSGTVTSNNFTGNPNFVNAGTSDFRLNIGSSAVDFGVSLGSPYNVDFQGTTRPQGGGYDAGAYEQTSGSPTAPVASFTQSTTSGAAPLSVSFTDTSTGAITTWFWTFGDGNTSSLQSPGHIYTGPGVYVPTLLVTGPDGFDDFTGSAITVTGGNTRFFFTR